MPDRFTQYPLVCTAFGLRYGHRCVRLMTEKGHGQGNGSVVVQFEDDKRIWVCRRELKPDPSGKLEERCFQRKRTPDQLVEMIATWVKESPEGGLYRDEILTKCSGRNIRQVEIKKCITRTKKERGMTTDKKKTHHKKGPFYCFKTS